MRKSLFTVIAAMLFGVSTATAAVYKFTFESFDSELTAAGQMTVNTAGEVTGVSGLISGLTDQTISAVAPNANFSSPALSPDGSFIYDNLFHSTGTAFDTSGLLFVTHQNPGGDWILWEPSATSKICLRSSAALARISTIYSTHYGYKLTHAGLT